MESIKERIQYEADYDLDDLSGQFFWKSILKSMIHNDLMDEIFHMERTRGILLTGSEGTGKTTLGIGYLGELKKSGYKTMYIRKNDLLSFKDQGRELAVQLGAECRKNLKTAVFIDDADGLKDLTDLAAELSGEFQRLTAEEIRTIWIFSAEKKEEVPQEIRDNTCLCELTVPDLAERVDFFQNLGDLAECCAPGIQKMAEKTEGFCMAELNRAAVFLLLQLKEQIIEKCGNDPAAAGILLKKGTPLISEEMFSMVLSRTVQEKPVTVPVENGLFHPPIRQEFTETEAGPVTEELEEAAIEAEDNDSWMDELDDF